MLSKENRLDKRHFKQLYTQGRKYRGEYGMLLVRKSNSKHIQFGFVVSKKIGNAVQRHRMTRLLREIVRERIKEQTGMECIYVAYKYCNEYNKLENDFKKQYKNAFSDITKS